MPDPKNKYSQPLAPPGPVFFNKKERDFVKQVTDEVTDRVVAQPVAYYPLSIEHSNYHPLYGEAIEKTFLPPIRVYALVNFEGIQTETSDFGVDKRATINIKFHKRRLGEDQNVFVREGDFVLYGDIFYEITELNEPKQLFGQIEYRYEIEAKCLRARKGKFNAE
tara:strand:- start:415 stop:909 length:495 start_codon:yes stop_codon:yes gene_type:complete